MNYQYIFLILAIVLIVLVILISVFWRHEQNIESLDGLSDGKLVNVNIPSVFVSFLKSMIPPNQEAATAATSSVPKTLSIPSTLTITNGKGTITYTYVGAFNDNGNASAAFYNNSGPNMFYNINATLPTNNLYQNGLTKSSTLTEQMNTAAMDFVNESALIASANVNITTNIPSSVFAVQVNTAVTSTFKPSVAWGSDIGSAFRFGLFVDGAANIPPVINYVYAELDSRLVTPPSSTIVTQKLKYNYVGTFNDPSMLAKPTIPLTGVQSSSNFAGLQVSAAATMAAENNALVFSIDANGKLRFYNHLTSATIAGLPNASVAAALTVADPSQNTALITSTAFPSNTIAVFSISPEIPVVKPWWNKYKYLGQFKDNVAKPFLPNIFVGNFGLMSSTMKQDGYSPVQLDPLSSATAPYAADIANYIGATVFGIQNVQGVNTLYFGFDLPKAVSLGYPAFSTDVFSEVWYAYSQHK